MSPTNVDRVAFFFLILGGFLCFFGLSGLVCYAGAECGTTDLVASVIAFQGLLLVVAMVTFLLFDAPRRTREKSHGA